jgi:hypothetical protein
LRAKLPFLAIEKLGDHAGVGKSLQNLSRLLEYSPTSCSVSKSGPYWRESQQPDEGPPGAYSGNVRPARKALLQFDLSIGQVTALCKHPAEGDVRQSSLRDTLQPESVHKGDCLAGERLSLPHAPSVREWVATQEEGQARGK